MRYNTKDRNHIPRNILSVDRVYIRQFFLLDFRGVFILDDDFVENSVFVFLQKTELIRFNCCYNLKKNSYDVLYDDNSVQKWMTLMCIAAH